MNISRRAFCTLVPVILAGCAITRHATADAILVSQPTVVNAANVGLGFYSSSQARPTRNYKRGDDFMLASNASLGKVRWWGLSEGRIFDDLRNFNQYTLEIFEGVATASGPLPGVRLWSQSFAPAGLSIAATGRASPSSGAAEYRYEATLSSPINLTGGKSYILAISARCINASGDAWQWQDSEFFGGHGANFSYAAGTWTAFQDTDSAFELIGTVVPAPSTAGVLLTLLAMPSGRRAHASSLAQRLRA
ncbi:MAG: hypothetical protein SFY96_00080 [Planctomycetota bacterium]|nr:hypothetical protein [Planctomycetota bacterium]